ncbi:MAG: family 78 glycoside hydrolase catalytic domain [Phycisphaerae bacterium]|nr:family 78 glycoside hydrolase catalytic domain [Phycisphaerae bacterium]
MARHSVNRWRWAAVAILGTTTAVAGELQPTALRCEYSENPLGIDAVRPRLSWVLLSEARGQNQTAYQVLAASTPAGLARDEGDLWDSGKVRSAESLGVSYAGSDLHSGQRVHWKVRVWDGEGRVSGWSEPAWWEMGLLDPADWQGGWIASPAEYPQEPEDFYRDDPVPLFRREFDLGKPIRRARVYVSGLGYYELRLNGKRVGDHLLDPAWTSYGKRVFYSTYDVTELLQTGRNAVGVMLGNGWYNPLPMKMWGRFNLREALTVGPPRAVVQLEVEYEDGTRQRVATDTNWRVGRGPILRNSVYLGELYDARREVPGWDMPGFDDGDWPTAVKAAGPIGVLRAQTQPPIRVTAKLRPVAVAQPSPGVCIFDMGQNFAGRVRLRVKGPTGTRVALRYGELLHADGTLNPMTAVAGQIKQPGLGGPGAPDVAWQEDVYILKGGDEEIYEPRFTFHGFRYVEVTGYPGRPTIDAIEGQRMGSDVRQVGTFACSHEPLNSLQKMTEWTLLSNLFGVQSDCPHREKFGYGGDIIVSCEMAMLNFDMAAFYAKTVRDHADAARENGGLTETAPFVGIADEGLAEGVGPIGWASVHPVLLWQLHQYYGDRELMTEQYEVAKRWVEFLESKAQDHLISVCIGDHETLAPKTVALTSTALYYHNVDLVARIARVLGRTADAEHYTALAGAIREAFNARFLEADTGRYDLATQAAQAFALYMDLVPTDELRGKSLEVLVKDILDGHKGHLSTGIFGTKYMLETLTRMGRADVAYTLVSQEDFPGWIHMLRNGATTLWEHWELSDNVYSHNHPMFGSVSEWFYKALAGIRPADDAVGFDRVVIRPSIVGDLTWARGAYESIRGRVACEWRLADGKLELDVVVPVGATATVYVPVRPGSQVSESGRPVGGEAGTTDGASGIPGVLRTSISAPGREVYRLLSGEYKFVVSGWSGDQP